MQLVAGAVAAHVVVVLHSTVHKAGWSGCPVGPATCDLGGLNLRLNGTWTVSQPRRFQGDSVWGSAVGQTKWRFKTLPMEGFPEAAAPWGRGARHY